MKRVPILNAVKRAGILLAAIAITVAIGAVDYVTGYELSFTVFYLLPILLVAWHSEKADTFAVVIFASAVCGVVDYISGHRYSSAVYTINNMIMIMVMYLVVGFLLVTVRKLLVRERDLSRTDFLTGVANSRSFYEIAGREIERSLRYGHPVSIGFIDVDNFKRVNDRMGHQAGDDLLRSVARRLSDGLRSVDVVARVGGDEFVIMLPETGSHDAPGAISKVIEHLGMIDRDGVYGISFSIGVVSWAVPSGNINELMQEADSLMYLVKLSGKNAVKYLSL